MYYILNTHPNTKHGTDRESHALGHQRHNIPNNAEQRESYNSKRYSSHEINYCTEHDVQCHLNGQLGDGEGCVVGG